MKHPSINQTSSTKNRRLFINRLCDLCGNTKDNTGLGLLIIDIKGFRKINSVFGYNIGDKILVETFSRLANAFKKDNAFRIGNDEFAIILPELLNPNMINLAANKVINIVNKIYKIEDINVKVGINIGISHLQGPLKYSDLLKKAEASLFNAKNSGKTFIVKDFTEDSNDETNLIIENELHESLDNNSLELFYQPKIDLQSGNPNHIEALARWVSPSLGPVSPIIFIPIIKEMGRMGDLTKWAINTAIRQLKDWPAIHGELSVAVNVCASLIDDPSLFDYTTRAINLWGIDPSKLTLEITEGSIIQDKKNGFEYLSKIKESGVKISIDDFGTGYSSLSYFKDIPADELKIDKSFVFNMLDNEDDRHITQVICDLAHKFNLSVVAEGVETKETLAALIETGCDYAQGYYFTKPLPQNKLIDWLNHYDKSIFF